MKLKPRKPNSQFSAPSMTSLRDVTHTDAEDKGRNSLVLLNRHHVPNNSYIL